MEYLVIVGVVALAAIVAFIRFGNSVEKSARCAGARILSLSENAQCASGKTGSALSSAVSNTTPTPPPATLTTMACVGGECNGGNCFVAGTPVLTAQGPRAIETLTRGDIVVSRDPNAERDVLAAVIATKRTHERPTVLVTVGSERLEVTPTHLFWVEERGWTPAEDLTVESHLRGLNGELQSIAALATSGRAETVYNIEVEGTHTYFAGSTPVLVHNDCDPLVAPEFTMRDLETLRDKSSVDDRVLVLYWWATLPNDARIETNREVKNARDSWSEDRIGPNLIDRAKRKFPYGLPTNMRTGIRDGSSKESLIAKQLVFDQHYEQARRDLQDRQERRRNPGKYPTDIRDLFTPESPLPPIFEMPKVTMANPSAELRSPFLNGWRIHHDVDVRRIADELVTESGVSQRGRFEGSDESMAYAAWRNIRDTGKGIVWRNGGAFFAEDALKPEDSGDVKFRKKLTQEAFDFALGVEVTRTEAGGIVLKPTDDGATSVAVKKLLEPGNLAILDVAAQVEAGTKSPTANGRFARADFDAVARDTRYPEDLRRAAAVFTKPVVEGSYLRRSGLFDRFDDADMADGFFDRQVTPEGLRATAEKYDDGIPFRLAPRLHRVMVRKGDGKTSEPVDIIDWSDLISGLHTAEIAALTGNMTIGDFDRVYNQRVGARAKEESAAARSRLDRDLDRLGAHGLDGVLAPDFEQTVGTEITLGQLDGKYDNYLNRAWYEKLGVGTWAAVKEVLMVPVGLVELLVYVGDHGNPVVLIKGRPDGAPLLHVFAGKAFNDPLGTSEAMSRAFEEWWLASSVEPDKTVGHAIGFVATFFIPFEKVVGAAKLSAEIARTLTIATEARMAGDLAKAQKLIERARTMSRNLTKLGRAESTAAEASKLSATPAQLAKEREAFEKLAKSAEQAVEKASDDLGRAGHNAADAAKPTGLYVIGPKCFVAGTQIAIAEDTTSNTCGETQKAIENVAVGDSVYTWDEETNERTVHRVSHTIRKETLETWDVTVRAEGRAAQHIVTTAEHPFFVATLGWVQAKHLRVDSELVGLHGETMFVAAIASTTHATPVFVFNFSVNTSHTYYVAANAGDTPLLVHNDPQCTLADTFANVGRPDDVMSAVTAALADGHKQGPVMDAAAQATRKLRGNPEANASAVAQRLERSGNRAAFEEALAKTPIDEAARAKAIRPIDTMAANPSAKEVAQAMSLYEKNPGAARMRDPMSVSEFLGKKNSSANDHSLRVEFLKPYEGYKGDPIVFLHSRFHGGDMYWNNRFKDVQLANVFEHAGLGGSFAEASHIPNEGAALVRWWNKYQSVAEGAPPGMSKVAVRQEVARSSLLSYISGDADGIMHNANNGGFALFKDATGKESWRGAVIDGGAAWNNPPIKPWGADVMGLGPTLAGDIPKDMIPGLVKMAEASADDLARWSKFPTVDDGARAIVRAQRDRAQEILTHYGIKYKKPK